MRLDRSPCFALVLLAAFSGCGKAGGQATPKPSSAAETPDAEGKKPDAKGEEKEKEELPESVTLTAAAIAEAGITTWAVQPVNLEHMLVLKGTVGHDENRLLQVAANVGPRGVDPGGPRRARAARRSAARHRERRPRPGARGVRAGAVELRRARASAYERAKTLVEAKAISSGEFQSREGEYLSKKAAAEAAERTLHLYGDSEEEVARLRRPSTQPGAVARPTAPRSRCGLPSPAA